MMTLKMTPSTRQSGRDIAVVNGLVESLSGPQGMRQRLENALRLYRNEWILMPEEGIDWFTILRRRQNHLSILRRAIERVLLADPEVLSVTRVRVSARDDARQLVLEYRVESVYGTDDGRLTT